MLLLSLPPPGAILFLRLGNRLLRSYLDPKLSVHHRIEFAFYALFVTEAWYTDLKERSGPAMAAREQQRKEKNARRRADEQRRMEEIFDERKKEDRSFTKKAAWMLLSKKKKE